MEKLSRNGIQLMIGLLQNKIDSADTAKTDITLSRLDARRCQQALIELDLYTMVDEYCEKVDKEAEKCEKSKMIR